jgi:hypothetical protein
MFTAADHAYMAARCADARDHRIALLAVGIVRDSRNQERLSSARR